MRRLLAALLLLLPSLAQAEGLHTLPLRMRLAMPLFQVVPSGAVRSHGSGGGGGGGGSSWGPQPGNGCVVRTGSSIFSTVTFVADTGITVVGGDCLAGTVTIGLDLAVGNTFSAGTASVTASGAVGTEYIENDRIADYFFPVANTPYYRLILAAGVGTSGGVPYFTATADKIGSSAALTANMPVIGGGAGAAPTVGTVSGNTTAFVTTTGTQTSGDCVKIDANGNHIANGSSCGGSSTFNPATTFHINEEFATGEQVSARAGTNGINYGTINTGTPALDPGTANHPGILQLIAHATNDNSGEALNLGNATFVNSIWTANDWTLDILLTPVTVANSSLWVGLSNTGTGIQTASSGIWITRDTDLSQTTYVFALCDSATTGCNSAGDATNQDSEPSTITPTDGVAHRFRIRRAGSGVGGLATIYMRVDDETEKTFCSSGCSSTAANLPTADILPTVVYVTRTTSGANRRVDVDYIDLTITLTRY